MSTTPSIRSKRHSFNIHPSSGPRPLQLVNGITTKPTSAVTATTSPSTSTSLDSHIHDGVSPTHPSQSTPRTPRTPNNVDIRRHSSISYKNSSYEHSENDVPSTQFQTKSRPKSLMFPAHSSHPNTLVAVSSPLARDSSDSRDWSFDPGLTVNGAGGTGPTEERERRPLTLVEKHADLLRFIAQKESKCLELRSQLAVHEAELVQLKRKWERIVSRGFDSPLSPRGSTSPSPQSPLPSTTSIIPAAPIPTGTVFEGIKDSVQGVSRLIASGLTASCDHQYHDNNLASPLSLPSHSRPSTTQPRSRAKPRPHSLYSQYPSFTTSSHIRSANLSASSNATSSTSTSADSVSTPTTASVGTRFSAASSDSSTSSFFEEDEQNATAQPTMTGETSSSLTAQDAKVAEDAELSANSSIDSWSSSELIVRDTGATPMMSPNPKFKWRRQREKTGFGKNNDEKRGVDLEPEKNEEECIVTIESKGDNDEVICPGMGNSSAVSRSNSNSRCHRRKSRDVSGLVSSTLDDSPCLDLNSNSTPILEPSQTRSTLSPSFISLPGPTTKSQRNSLVGTFAPVSTIPGLSLAESAAMLVTGASRSSGEISSPSHPMRMEMENEARRAGTYQHQQTQQIQEHPPSSWMGKKWDKWTQKRASGLFSDVSQTLAHAFSLSMSNNTTHPTPHSTSSILDQEDDFLSSAIMDEPMKPTTISRTADVGDMSCHGRKLDESEWNW